MKKKLLLFVALFVCVGVITPSFAQNTKLDDAKENFKGFNVTINAGLLESNIKKYFGESLTRNQNDVNWVGENLLNYTWGRGNENRSGNIIGLSLGYNWVTNHRWLLGVELSAAKTNIEYELYGDNIERELPFSGSTEIIKNADLKAIFGGNIVLGKIFGKHSDFLIYAKGGVSNGLMRFYDRNSSSTNNNSNVSGKGGIFTVAKNKWNWGYNVGGGLKYSITPKMSIGLEYLYTKFRDLKEYTTSYGEPITHQLDLRQHHNMHTVNLSLTLNLFGKTNKSKPVPTQCYYPEKRKTVTDTVKVIKYQYEQAPVAEHEFGKPEVGKTVVLKNIYYDFDKANIREDAKGELDKVVTYLKRYPNVKIELKSYTDNRGSAEYNMTLSQKRAESAANYIINSGINPDRIVARGYGKSQPIVDCTDCTEEEHQQNRRTEFTILYIL